jgi:hypothetical protein
MEILITDDSLGLLLTFTFAVGMVIGISLSNKG